MECMDYIWILCVANLLWVYIERIIMTFAGITQRITKLYHNLLLCILPSAQMKNFL